MEERLPLYNFKHPHRIDTFLLESLCDCSKIRENFKNAIFRSCKNEYNNKKPSWYQYPWTWSQVPRIKARNSIYRGPNFQVLWSTSNKNQLLLRTSQAKSLLLLQFSIIKVYGWLKMILNYYLFSKIVAL